MNTHIPFWRRQVSLPVAVTVLSVSIVGCLMMAEYQAGLSASIRSNEVYGALPSHGAAPLQLLRRTSSSSASSLTPAAQRRMEARLRLRMPEEVPPLPEMRVILGSGSLKTRSGSVMNPLRRFRLSPNPARQRIAPPAEYRF